MTQFSLIDKSGPDRLAKFSKKLGSVDKVRKKIVLTSLINISVIEESFKKISPFHKTFI